MFSKDAKPRTPSYNHTLKLMELNINYIENILKNIDYKFRIYTNPGTIFLFVKFFSYINRILSSFSIV